MTISFACKENCHSFVNNCRVPNAPHHVCMPVVCSWYLGSMQVLHDSMPVFTQLILPYLSTANITGDDARHWRREVQRSIWHFKVATSHQPDELLAIFDLVYHRYRRSLEELHLGQFKSHCCGLLVECACYGVVWQIGKNRSGKRYNRCRNSNSCVTRVDQVGMRLDIWKELCITACVDLVIWSIWEMVHCKNMDTNMAQVNSNSSV